MDGYIEYGLSLYRSFKIKKFTYNLRGDIINLGNKQYDIVKSYPMPGRSYKLNLQYSFFKKLYKYEIQTFIFCSSLI